MKRLGVFAKFWESGRVKTRLGRQIGFDQAARLYRSFLETTLQRCRLVAEERWLAFSPAEYETEFRKLCGPNWFCLPQVGDSLGQRIETFFDAALKTDEDRAILIGSDSPTLATRILDQAFEALQHYPVVLGPTLDGGYYLVGCRGTVAPIFDGIAWSTSQVWEQTVAHLETAGLSHAVLPTWYDVDQLEDLHQLHGELQQTKLDVELGKLRAVVVEVLAGAGGVDSPENGGADV